MTLSKIKSLDFEIEKLRNEYNQINYELGNPELSEDNVLSFNEELHKISDRLNGIRTKRNIELRNALNSNISDLMTLESNPTIVDTLELLLYFLDNNC